MSNRVTPRAQRRVVVSPDPLVGGPRYDYADSFEIQLPATDIRSPEQLFRVALKHASSALRWAVPIVHRRLLRFRLGPLSSPEHILGWHVLTSGTDVIQLEAVGPLMRGDIIGRRVDPTTVVFTTFVFYTRRAPARILWAITAPIHRRVAPYLLEQAAATSPTRT